MPFDLFHLERLLCCEPLLLLMVNFYFEVFFESSFQFLLDLLFLLFQLLLHELLNLDQLLLFLLVQEYFGLSLLLGFSFLFFDKFIGQIVHNLPFVRPFYYQVTGLLLMRV